MNERALISFLKKNISTINPELKKGIGDDCALIAINSGKYLAVTTDSFVENTHFSLKYFSPGDIGAKAMAVNISDICAMGAVPKYAFINIGVPARFGGRRAKEVLASCVRYSVNYGIDVAGGDITRSETVFLSVTIAGEAEKKNVLLRSGAKTGDTIFVTGFLGDAAAGRAVLESARRNKRKAWEAVPVNRHLRPVPRYYEGRLLAKSGMAGACMDLSDGLASDLESICAASGRGAVIDESKIPVSFSAARVCEDRKIRILDAALYGGEDYELLFTVPDSKMKKFYKFAEENNFPAFPVGRITASKGIFIRKRKKKQKLNSQKAFRHF